MRKDLLELTGNVLLAIICPFIYLFHDNPHKDLFDTDVGKDDENGNSK